MRRRASAEAPVMMEADLESEFIVEDGLVTGLARGLEVLRCFQKGGQRYLANADLARGTGLARATISRLTDTLTRLGYLTYNQRTCQYALDAGVLSLGYAFLASLDIRQIAHPFMQKLADYVEATVVLGARDRLHVVVLEICEGHPTFQMRFSTGSRIPYETIGVGRAYLCGVDEKQQSTLLKRFEHAGANLQSIKSNIQDARRDYQQHGFCYSVGNWSPDTWAVGTPLISADGATTLALSCGGILNTKMTEKKLLQDIGPRLIELREKLLVATAGRF